MKNSLLKLSAIVGLVCLTSFGAKAQIATACAGDNCGKTSSSFRTTLNCADVSSYELLISPNSLCPNTDALVTYNICGQYGSATVNSSTGSIFVPLHMSKLCNCKLEVTITLVYNGTPVACKRQGYATVDLLEY